MYTKSRWTHAMVYVTSDQWSKRRTIVYRNALLEMDTKTELSSEVSRSCFSLSPFSLVSFKPARSFRLRSILRVTPLQDYRNVSVGPSECLKGPFRSHQYCVTPLQDNQCVPLDSSKCLKGPFRSRQDF